MQALRLPLALPTLLLLAPQAVSQDTGADWPQWRGPERSGVSSESGWDPVGRAEPLWRASLGLGHSSFAIAAGRVFTLGYDVESGLDTIHCFDAETGEPRWTHTYPSEIWDTAHDGGTLTTPCVVGDDVYTSNREGKVFCLDVASGEVRWQRDLRADLGLEPPTWGFSASPLVVGERVVMNVDKVVALDRATGEQVWCTERSYGIAYSTPTPFELEGRALLASLSGDGLAVLDLADGAEVAFHEWIKRPQIYPMSPVVIGDRIFISGGYERGCAMLRLAGGELEELWGGRTMRNKMSGCVLWNDHLFGFDESILKCIDLDGNLRWRTRGLGTGSMTVAGGRLVILDGKGQIIVAEANPEEYVELSRRSVFEDGTGWSSPVLSHGRIYCRSSKGAMACLDHTGSSDVAVAAVTTADAGELPAASALVARHVAAVGGAERIAALREVHMTGPGESLRNTVGKDTVVLDWAAGRGFSWRDDSGFQVAHDAEIAWTVGSPDGPEIFQDEAADAVREAGDVGRILDPARAYRDLSTLERTTFDNRPCFAVRASTAAGLARTLYFDVESGLFAGHDGDGIAMWTLDAYEEFGGVRLPTHWAFYEPALGEMTSATFEAVSVLPEDAASPFEQPPLIRLLQRTPEEIALADAELRETYADLLGAWRPTDDPEPGGGFDLVVGGGFVVLESGERPPSQLLAADDGTHFVVIGAEYVSIRPVRDESGAPVAIEVYVGGELDGRLERASE